MSECLRTAIDYSGCRGYQIFDEDFDLRLQFSTEAK